MLICYSIPVLLTFISFKFATSLNCMHEELNKPLYVSTPLKNITIANIIFKNCIIQIGKRKLVAGLVQLNMHDFDIIHRIN